ncbi:DUF5819 family protein [Streptomyces winkii]|uniref:DUF5819 family protein n=1 Tax=Streptomyces winkii TaxID=3051178 RepID=UPI0028D3485B|nr:DUF5819 family protein [Streptomyces sp. DSM 40971]
MEPEEQQAPQAEPRPEPPPGADAGGSGFAGLSRPGRVIVAATAALAVLAVAVHLSMVFLHVAPPNTLSKKHGAGIDDYVYPEFEQNWKLFAPNPLQQNIAVHARARVAKDDGSTETTGWVNLSKMDGKAIDHNIAPSHVQQNELRRGWEFYRGSHDEKGKALGLRGRLSESYVKRIVMLRFGRELNGGTVERIQVRSATTPVRMPSWSDEKSDAKTEYQVQPWWQIGSADLPGGWEK